MNEIIKNYAHDYRDMTMSEEQITKMFESFINEYQNQKVMNKSMKDRIFEAIMPYPANNVGNDIESNAKEAGYQECLGNVEDIIDILIQENIINMKKYCKNCKEEKEVSVYNDKVEPIIYSCKDCAKIITE